MSTGHLYLDFQICRSYFTKKKNTPNGVLFLFVISVHFRYLSSKHGTGQICYIFLPFGKKNYGVAAIKLAASRCPPDICI